MKNTYVKIIMIVMLFFGHGLCAQEQDIYVQDTLWLKTGEIIPCKISSMDRTNNLMTIQAYDTTGSLMYRPVPFDLIKTYIIGPEVRPEVKQPSQYRIDLLNGTRLTGTIISENDSVIVMELKDLGELKIRRDKIDKMIPLDASPEIKKSLWFKNPNATRLLFAPTPFRSEKERVTIRISISWVTCLIMV